MRLLLGALIALAGCATGSAPVRAWPDDRPDLVVNLVLRRIGDRFLFTAGTLERVSEMAEQLADVGLSSSVLAEFTALEALRYRLRSQLPGPLKARGFLLENWQWLGLLGLALLRNIKKMAEKRVV